MQIMKIGSRIIATVVVDVFMINLVRISEVQDQFVLHISHATLAIKIARGLLGAPELFKQLFWPSDVCSKQWFEYCDMDTSRTEGRHSSKTL